MPHSLRARLSGLRYKKIISEKDYNRMCNALDNEVVLDKIRAEIDLETRIQVKHYTNTDAVIDAVLDVIDEYKAEKEDKK